MKTTVVHCKKEKYDIYIGRPSKWGNPFPLGNYLNRVDCVNDYKEWFRKQTDLIKDLPELKGKRLGCWCHPLACHGDFLAEMADKHD